MQDFLTRPERAAVDALKADYEKLSDAAKAEAAKSISFAERYFTPTVLIGGALCGWLGFFAGLAVGAVRAL